MKLIVRIRQIGFKRLCMIVLYYGCFRYLPRSSFPLLGPPSNMLRSWCCRGLFRKCGRNLTVERLAFFGSGLNVEIGDNSGLGRNCFVQSNITIGANVLIGPNFYVVSRNHAFEDSSCTILEQGYKPTQRTIIEDDIWIGRDCMFTPGRHIRTGIVIAARSVVTKDFDEYSVIGGNPARVIKVRRSSRHSPEYEYSRTLETRP